MQFQFPKKRINDTSWFLDGSDRMIFGTVKMISLAVKEDSCSVWYTMLINEIDTIVVKEDQLITQGDLHVPSPKYHIGDAVTYTFLDKKKKLHETNGIISRIEIHIQDKSIEYAYIMEDDDNYWVMDDDIQGFTEPAISIDGQGEVVDMTVLPIGSGSDV